MHAGTAVVERHLGPEAAEHRLALATLLSQVSMHRFVVSFVLQGATAAIRQEASAVLRGLWEHATTAERGHLFEVVNTHLPSLPLFGSGCKEYLHFVGAMLRPSHSRASGQAGLSEDMAATIVHRLVALLKESNRVLSDHELAPVYRGLGSLLELDGHFLDSRPIHESNQPELPSQSVKLDALKAEIKFTESCQIVKLACSQMIYSGVLRISDIRRGLMVSSINIYCNNKPVTDVGELKNKWELWKRVKTLAVPPGAAEARFDFAIPLCAHNLLIEYAAFHEQSAQAEKLQCPRCSRTVTDKHGICKHCGDNAYQCRHCRNINYEKLDAFLCNECGFCKHARFEYTLVVKPSYVVERITNEAERTKLVALIDAELENANKRYAQLSAYKRPLEQLLTNLGDAGDRAADHQLISSLPGQGSLKVNRKIAVMAVLYGKESKAAHASLCKSMQTLQSARAELLRYMHTSAAGPQPPDAAKSDPSIAAEASATRNGRYDCALAFVLQCLALFEELARAAPTRAVLLERGLVQELFEHNICNMPGRMSAHTTHLLCLLTCDSADASRTLHDLLRQRLELCLTHHRHLQGDAVMHYEISLLCELCALEDGLWPHRLNLLMRVFLRGLEQLSSALVCNRVVLPCLRVLVRVCAPQSYPAAPSMPATAVADTASAPSAKLASAAASSPRLVAAPARGAAANPSGGRLSSSAEASSPCDDAALRATLRFEAWLRAPQATYDAWAQRHGGVASAAPGSGCSPVRCSPSLPSPAVSGPPTTGSPAPKAATKGALGAPQSIALRLGRRWRDRACWMALPALLDHSWLCRLLLCEASQAIREEVVALLTCLAEQHGPSRAFYFLDMLVGLLPRACAASCAASCEYFELLRKLMASREHRLYLAARGLLADLCALIGAEARRVRLQEDSAMVDMSQGYVLKVLVEMLASLLELPTVSSKLKESNQLPVLLHALLCVRGLVMQKTRFIDECGAQLLKLLTALHADSEADRRLFVSACVRSMREHAQGRAEDGRSLIFIFEQLVEIVCPSRPEPDYRLTLNKTATQEEFIRGAMTKNPYSSREIGPLMRDVKNKICRDLDLAGLIEDDNGMELLVAGQIIKLDLPVTAVYEQVWACSPSAQAYGEPGAPMVVIYRLQGLDGEATEPIVESVDEDRGEEQDPEAEYAIAAVVGEEGGLSVMMDILRRSTPLLRVRECAALLLKLLQHSCKLKQNRARMLQMGAPSELLHLACGALGQEALGSVAERLLMTAESLLEEELSAGPAARVSSGAAAMEVERSAAMDAELGGGARVVVAEHADESQGTHELRMPQKALLDQLLAGLECISVQASPSLAKALCKLLPLATCCEAVHVRALLAHFSPFTDFDSYDTCKHGEPRYSFMLECLVAVVSVTSPAALADMVKTACVEHRVVSRAAAYLVTHLPSEKESNQGKLWEAALARPALPFVLQLLGALARGHVAVQQQLLTPELMARLHALEGHSSSATKAIGTLAESLLEALRECEAAAAAVDQLRQASATAKRKAALDKRQQILASMGMARGSGGKNVIVAEKAAVMQELETESGHVCVVCGEGETYRAGEPLGCYCFCKRVPLPAASSVESAPSVPEFCYTTVTHFGVIHFACHREASRAERTMKQPKEEWEGATLRNSQTKCNNLFPFWGATVSEEAYAVSVEQWWSHLQHAGRVDASRCRLLAHDIKLLLLRFALEESFSTYSKGGGRESNIKLLPYLVLMATFLLDARASPQRLEQQRALSTWLGGAGQLENVLFMLVMSLLLQSPEEWRASRMTFLQRAVLYAGANGQARERAPLLVPHEQRSPARSQRSPARVQRASPAEPSATAQLLPPAATSLPGRAPAASTQFETVRPMLLFWLLVDRLQGVLKGERPWHATPAPPTGSEEGWLATMRERLRVHDQQVLKELQGLVEEYEEKLLLLGDFDEFDACAGVSGSARLMVAQTSVSASHS